MRFVRSCHFIENKLFVSNSKTFCYFALTGQRERQLPKLNVAGSIPVSRSNHITRSFPRSLSPKIADGDFLHQE